MKENIIYKIKSFLLENIGYNYRYIIRDIDYSSIINSNE